MKKVLSVCSVLSGIISVLSLIFGIRALTGHNFLISLRLFNMAANGTFFGFIGNIPGIAVTCLGFGVPAYFGFSKDIHSKKKGFIYGLVLTGICLLSLIVSVFTTTLLWATCSSRLSPQYIPSRCSKQHDTYKS